MEQITEMWQMMSERFHWLWNQPDAIWYFVAVTWLGTIYFAAGKMFYNIFYPGAKVPEGQDPTLSIKQAITCKDGDQNIAQGDGAIAKQENVRDAQIGVLRDNAEVKGGIHFNNK